jgi:tRNA dimethylallyltransferase
VLPIADDLGYRGPVACKAAGITYRQLLGHLAGEYDLPTAVEMTVRDNRRYARRQLTWFRAVPGIEWHDVEERGIAGTAEAVAARWREFVTADSD